MRFFHERLSGINPGTSGLVPAKGPLLSPQYMAAIIDGEGSIFTRKCNPHISVSNTSRALMERLFMFGGHAQERHGRGLGKKQAWDWAVGGEKAAIILRTCLPYFVIKHQKGVDALVEFAMIDGSNHAAFIDRARREAPELVAWEKEYAVMSPPELQGAIHADSSRRWPDMDIESEALALAEETGEVCRAVVKRRHGTRGTYEDWSAHLRQEVAQVGAVLFNIAEIEGFDLVAVVDDEHRRWVVTDTNHDPVGKP